MISDGQYSDSNQESFKLAQKLYVSFYSLYSSVPYTYDPQFYGLSPAGLAYGGLKSEFWNQTYPITSNQRVHFSEGYGGHVTYHQELWMLPLVSMFNPEMSKSIINSRFRRGFNTDSASVYELAREAARLENLEGVRYPWEQGDFGGDVSPFADARKSKIHTSADISYGMRSYLRHTHSREFLTQSVSSDAGVRGEDFLNEVAKYWNGRFNFETLTNQYEIRTVSFGEKSRPNEVNNEAFTNYIAAVTLDTYKYVLYLLDRNPYETQYSLITNEYDDTMRRARLPYDEFQKLFLEYDNFNTAQQNEETFVPFINFPLLRYLTYEEKKNIYDKYAIVSLDFFAGHSMLPT
jgi:trehalose/maltose hydrolase-like predicted phosphorylase